MLASSDALGKPVNDVSNFSAKERTRTSTGVTPLAPQGLSVPGADLEELLAAEARSLLMAAASGIPVEPERMRGFARTCLEVSEVGRLALAVLDGGVFAPRRTLELAEVLSEALMSAPAAKPSGT